MTTKHFCDICGKPTYGVYFLKFGNSLDLIFDFDVCPDCKKRVEKVIKFLIKKYGGVNNDKKV